MSDRYTIDRREFARGSAMALLSGVAVTVSACAGGGGGGAYPTAATPPAAAPPTSDTEDGAHAVISANHGHEAVITAADFAAADTLLLDIRGQADHGHLVELSVADLDRIQQGTQVTKSSTDTRGHHHEVTFASTTTVPDGY